MPTLLVALVGHINGLAKNVFYFASLQCELKLVKVGMERFSIVTQIQNILIIAPPWILLLEIHWQSVILLAIKLKSMTLVAELGLMFQPIHSILRKLFK